MKVTILNMIVITLIIIIFVLFNMKFNFLNIYVYVMNIYIEFHYSKGYYNLIYRTNTILLNLKLDSNNKRMQYNN